MTNKFEIGEVVRVTNKDLYINDANNGTICIEGMKGVILSTPDPKLIIYVVRLPEIDRNVALCIDELELI